MIRGGYWGGAWGLSWAGTWGEAWLLLNQPYQELSLKGQVFVRSYLSRLYAADIADQIVSVATLNNLSVVDAEAVVAAKIARKSLSSVERSREPDELVTIDRATYLSVSVSAPRIEAVHRPVSVSARRCERGVELIKSAY